MNRARNQCPDPEASVRKQIAIIEDDFRISGVRDTKVDFLCEQLQLVNTPPTSRRYSQLTTKVATELFLSSRNAYRATRSFITLPHPSTLRDKVGPVNDVGSMDEARTTLEHVFEKLSGLQKIVQLKIDEIYVKPSVRYRGNHVIGYSVDKPSMPARTVLTFLVDPLMGGESFVLRLIPVFSLTAEFLQEQVMSVLQLIHDCGGRVLVLVTDSLSTNVKLFKFLLRDWPTPSLSPWKIKNPNDANHSIFLLFDPTHIFKNIRNNWISEKCKEIDFVMPDSGECVTARFKDVIEVYRNEMDNVVRSTRLTQKACFPSNIERQNVSLVSAVFSDATVSALSILGKEDTAGFCYSICRLWKILNVKRRGTDLRFNEPICKPIENTKDLEFLRKMADSISRMPGGKGRTRIRSLTTQTRDAAVHSLKCLSELAEYLLQDVCMKFILLGQFQNDRIEGEFGIYRQLNGGNYHIAVEQVLSSAKFRRLDLYAKLEVIVAKEDIHRSDCCESEMSEEELIMMDESLLEDVNSEELSEAEKGTLFYISGFIAFKHPDLKRNFSSESEVDESSEFTRLVSRGKLSFPSKSLLHFCHIAYKFFRLSSPNRCGNRLLRAFKMLMDSMSFASSNPERVARRLVNIFMKGMVTRDSDLLGSCNKRALSKSHKMDTRKAAKYN